MTKAWRIKMAVSIALLAIAGCSGSASAPPKESSGVEPSGWSAPPSPASVQSTPPAASSGPLDFAGPDCALVTGNIHCDDCGLEAPALARPEAERCLTSALLDPLSPMERGGSDPRGALRYRQIRAAHALGVRRTPASRDALLEARRRAPAPEVVEALERALQN